ncbi:MAG: OsmC family protein [Thermaerobacter sp.]|nr:OsmC family protein [Thermaerobacter sp.]
MSEQMAFTVHSASEAGMLTSHRTQAGVLLTDEPPAMGGSGQAPNPIEMLLAAWSGCLVATARMVAREHGVNLGGITATVEGSIDPRRVQGDRTAPAGLCSAQAVLRVSVADPLPWLAADVESRCPVSGVIGASGADIQISIEHADPAEALFR